MDERKQCQKCGHGWVSTRYIKAVDQLKNECTCGYSWWEPTYEQRTQRATTERREQS